MRGFLILFAVVAFGVFVAVIAERAFWFWVVLPRVVP